MERSAISRADAEAFLRDTDFKWYQRFELTPGVFTPGTRDVLALLDSAGVAHNQSGVRVLDIGTTNGGVAFEAERRGADRVRGDRTLSAGAVRLRSSEDVPPLGRRVRNMLGLRPPGSCRASLTSSSSSVCSTTCDTHCRLLTPFGPPFASAVKRS